MSVERLRNVMTGEIRDIDTNSDEYAGMINEVYDHQGSARPKWEITGQHHARRLDSGDVSEEDLGYAFKPIPGAEVDLSEVGPEVHPERALTEGEVEMGVGSYEDKMSGIPLVGPEVNSGREVERMETVPVDERRERGEELAGSTNAQDKRSSRRSSSKTSAGSSGSTPSGSGGSGSGSGSTASSGGGASSGGSTASGSGKNS